MDDKLNVLMADLLRMDADKVTDELTMQDSDVWDSLKHMELIVSIEDEFDVELSADDIVNMLSVKAIRDILQKKGMRN